VLELGWQARRRRKVASAIETSKCRNKRWATTEPAVTVRKRMKIEGKSGLCRRQQGSASCQAGHMIVAACGVQ
jgi:hypothetical protein